MKLGRFALSDGAARVGMVTDDDVLHDLSAARLTSIAAILEPADYLSRLEALARQRLPAVDPAKIRILCPIDEQEVWAAGVTYLRSKTARMDESDFSATAYDKVYEAARPELFFKSLPQKVSGPEMPVGIRHDSKWSVPEPELSLAINSQGQVRGYTLGNDMSSRDIEGENLLYLPQAKTYQHSCALGPWIVVGVGEPQVREWTLRLEIEREGKPVFQGETSVAKIKRSFDELAGFLYRCQSLPNGAILLTGTGIVPPDTFTLQAGDLVKISCAAVGLLQNRVVVV
jgi:2-dehydro-3-deoxy-D-arabinonate dehydratase